MSTTTRPDLELDTKKFHKTMERFRFWQFWFQPTLVGAENIPENGAALIVSNHGTFGFDLSALIRIIHMQTDRALRSMGDRVVFKTPGFRDLARNMGIVEGSPENADYLLQNGELMLVYPGGAREAMPDADEKYKLFWDNADGFAEVAARNNVPIIPIAGIGVDDVYRQVVSRETVRESRIGQWIQNQLGEKYIMPIYSGYGPMPRREQITYHVGEPVYYENSDKPTKTKLKSYHKKVKNELEKLIASGLEERDNK